MKGDNNLSLLDISSIANTLVSQSSIFNCSLKEAWDNYMHPALTQSITFEETKKYIDEKTKQGGSWIERD